MRPGSARVVALALVAVCVSLTGASGARGAPRGCTDVDSANGLVDAVVAGCKLISIANDASIDLAQVPDNAASSADAVVEIPDGVTIQSGRSADVQGGLLYLSTDVQKSMLGLGNNSRVRGLRLRGDDEIDTTPSDDNADGIRVDGVTGVVVDDNEIYGWPDAGVNVGPNVTPQGTAGPVQADITNNFIHNNVKCGAGYGVAVGHENGNALIERNVFDYNRHDVAGGHSAPHLRYDAELNFVLTSGPTCDGNYNQHFDVHGSDTPGTWIGGAAGDDIEIRDNTIRGAQVYAGDAVRPAFELRGTPTTKAVFADNAIAHQDEASALKIRGANDASLRADGKLIVSGNSYGVDTAGSLAVGDFDGDGCSDVFQSTGTVWVYSPCGRREWRVLNQSSIGLDKLAFGDFNGDGKTDVFTQDGDRWLVSYGGTSAWTALPFGSNVPMSEYRFGDFNGDGKTDVFRADGSRFFFSSGGRTPWEPLAKSNKSIDDVRLGDFNGDGKTDVFGVVGGNWSVSYGGSTPWRRLNRALSSNLGRLVFADFNGDGRTDVARSKNGAWQVSWGGATPWQTLQTGRQPSFAAGMLFGDFNRDGRADVLQYGVLDPSVGLVPSPRFELSSGGVRPLVTWSSQDMT
jgi:hypothetical protein